MQDSKPMTIGIFDDRARAQHAITELKQAGFGESEIGVTARDADGDGEAHDTQRGTHAKEGAVAGLATGAGVGALWGLGVLAGVVPGIGTAIAGGTLAALVSSAAAGAATAGLAGTLIGLGFREDEAKYYDEQFRAGRSVVTVRANGRGGEAASILRRNGAHDLSSRDDGLAGAGTASGQARSTLTMTSGTAATGAQTLEAREEQLRINERVEVEKRPVVTADITVGNQTTQSTESVDATPRKEAIKLDERGRANVRTKRGR
jgi:hypothetical protein